MSKHQSKTSASAGAPGFIPAWFGQYYLIDRTARGGMSEIFLAKSVGIGGFQKPLIIKKLFPEFSGKQRYVRRFINESRTLALLNHANIVQVFDMGRIGGDFYIALEYIEGRNMAHVLARAKRKGALPSLEFAIHSVLELAKGLAYAHRKRDAEGEPLNLVHQDVNCFNVMVSYEAEIKIIDFGIARIFQDEPGGQLMPVAGKLLYFSPEQLKGGPVDHRVDIYGVGMFLYEVLTGERLFEHRDTVEGTVKAILNTDIPKKIREHDRIHPEIKPIITKAMAFNPEQRYGWIEEFAADIKAAAHRLSLNLDQAVFANYVKGLFTRERGLDTERMRLLMRADALPDQPTEEMASMTLPISGPLLKIADEHRELKNRLTALMDGRTGEGPKFLAGAVRHEAGTRIFRQGDQAREVYFIQSGMVELIVKGDETTKRVALLRAGDVFGETALLPDGFHSVTAIAVQDTALIPIDRDTFYSLIGRSFSRKFILRLASKLRDVSVLLAGLLVRDPLMRMLYALTFFGGSQASKSSWQVDLEQVKGLFGLDDRNKLRKYLAKLETLEIIELIDNRVTVKDTEKLENILKLLAGGGEP
jgi:serine/threonine-protein kinase